MKKPYILLVLFFLLSYLMKAQEIRFKEHTDEVHSFSLRIPEKWSIISEKSNSSEVIAICKPNNTDTEKLIYEDCYEDQIYYHNSICGITCKEMGYLSAAGECEYFYFVSENQTIEIATNGRSLDKKVSDEIIKSFQFN